MGVAWNPHCSISSSKDFKLASGSEIPVNSMSQGFHQGIFSFSNGFDRSTTSVHHHQPHHIAQQSRRDKLRVQGFDPPPPPPPLVGIEEVSGELPGYETAGMLSEMFNFPPGAATAADLLDNQMGSNYRLSRPTPVANEWYGNRSQGMNADSAAAMQLFLMNPHPKSPSPPPPQPTSSSHMQTFQSAGVAAAAAAAFGDNSIHHSQFTWAGGDNNNTKISGVVDSQGLSLSLSSSLQQLESAKAEDLRIGDGGVLYYGLGNGGSTTAAASSYPSMKNLRNHPHNPHQESLHLQASVGILSQNQNQNHQHHGQLHVGYGSSSLGMVNVLRISKYAKPARELLEEFCSVGRGQFKNKKLSSSSNPNQGSNTTGAGATGSSPSSSKDIPPLSSADRIEYQRRKVKLISMIDEVEKRYNHYCEQMQMVVNSFDSVMGFGAATPYTALAQKAMSRHFRCLKDAIAAQLKHTCELLGEKDGTTATGVTKGETPRLRMLEESLRQQRAFHQMGMMEQEAWRPQRGLPERSVNILRAWLFEHFLHPYPSDTDKHLLARQTGLSRNQVSNWFINARVRLWKPMVEEMYQKEAKEEEEEREGEGERSQQGQASSSAQTQTATTAMAAAETTTESASATSATTAMTAVAVPVQLTPPLLAGGGGATTASSSKITSKRSEINSHDNNPSFNAINSQCFSVSKPNHSSTTATAAHNDMQQRFPSNQVLDDTCRQQGHGGILEYGSTTLLRFGSATTTTGDVSLTLGLRHAGNLPEQSPFAVRDFGGC